MIYVTGDLHGDFSPLFNFANSEEGKRLTKDDYVIVLGDFGIWPDNVLQSAPIGLCWTILPYGIAVGETGSGGYISSSSIA